MSYSSRSNFRRRKQPRFAAIFVDYNNLIEVLHRSLPSDEIPDDYVLPLLTQLRTVLHRKHRLQTTTFRAYGALNSHAFDDGAVLHALYASGAEPRFVSSSTAQDSTLRLGIDVIETLLVQPDVHTFILVSGDRAYLPLIRQIRERGRHTVLATLAAPDVPQDVTWTDDAISLDLVNLLDESLRQHLFSEGAGRTATRSRPRSFERLDDAATLNTLEIIEDHFGQYDEIYLTPLLRKLSDEFDHPDYDPKTIISELEDAGAVRLEKRHGTPYDYTVLIVEQDHPDVAIIQERMYQEHRPTTLFDDVEEAYQEDSSYLDDGDDIYDEEDPYPDAYDEDYETNAYRHADDEYAPNGEDTDSYTSETESVTPDDYDDDLEDGDEERA